MKKQPEQTEQTRRAMIDAFWELAETHGIYAVTISAIAKKAGYNRSTFYAYFSDMPDIIAQAEDEMIEFLQSRLKSGIAQGGFDDFDILAEIYIDAFMQCDDKIFLLIGKNGDPNFRSVVIDAAVKMFREIFTPIGGAAASEYIVAYVASAGLGLFTYWHETGKKLSVTELAKIYHTLATQGMRGAVRQI